MGMQFRKRTSGKNAWLNFSASKKNGLGASVSVKLADNITANFSGKRANRATVNLGNGFRWVGYGASKAKSKTAPKTVPKNTTPASFSSLATFPSPPPEQPKKGLSSITIGGVINTLGAIVWYGLLWFVGWIVFLHCTKVFIIDGLPGAILGHTIYFTGTALFLYHTFKDSLTGEEDEPHL